MELVSMAKEVLQDGAERAASYRLGQSALRQMDRVLWVVEKCARWAVPPPLDQDERPQPELVRPLPWLFFLVMLVALRVTKESISLLNLIMGKPPLRSADVVMYIQSRRRYLRTLKYQGTRLMRERRSWRWVQAPAALRDLLRRAACPRAPRPAAAASDDQVLVVKRSKRGRETASPVVSASETTMERLIEKMMVDLDADSDEDSSFTLTNLTSPKSDRSDFTVESDQEIFHNDTQTTQKQPLKPQEQPETTQIATQQPQVETPTNQNDTQPQVETPTTQNDTQPQVETPTTQNDTQQPEELTTTQNNTDCGNNCDVNAFSSTPEKNNEIENERAECTEIPKEIFSTPEHPVALSPTDETKLFLEMEATSKIPRTSNSEPKIANGRTAKSVPSKKKGAHAQERDRRNSERRAKSMSANNSM